jgi:hypothetical protein
MQKPLAVLVIVLVFGGFAQAQSLSVDEGQDQLHLISKSLAQDWKDLVALSTSRAGDCVVYGLLNDLLTSANSSADTIDSAKVMFRMYLLVSNTTDRARIRAILEPQVAFFNSNLSFDIQNLNLALAQSQVPAGAAVLGTRVRDNIRAASDVLQRVTLR